MNRAQDAAAGSGLNQPTKRPRDTALRQQRLKSWQPILDPTWVIGAFVIIGVAFVPTGVKLNQMSDDVVEVVQTYDAYNDPNPLCGIKTANEGAKEGRKCAIEMTVPKDMKPPIFLHYEIDNFHQNHKRYEASRDDAQLLGSTAPQSDRVADGCRPLSKVGNMTLNPCGLIANTLFNDVITLASGVSSDNVPLVMREDGIAWKSDLDFKFRQPDGFRRNACKSCDDCTCDGAEWSCTDPYEENVDGNKTCYQYFYPNDDTTQYLHETYGMVVSPIEGVMNEHFIVWMRVAALPRFRKLYGWFELPISAGTKVVFEVEPNWEVQSFRGSKSLILSESNTFGGKNNFLGYFFIIIGSICLGLAFLFGLKHKFRPRKIADKAYLRYKED